MKNTIIKISVIIPIFNMEKYLEECLESVLKQTLNEVEIICVDDGSKDNSLAILNRYAEQYHSIVVVSQKNKGAANARNKGLNLAQGEFVCFLDPDDFYPENDILEEMYKAAVENQVNICGGSFNSLIEGKVISEYYDATSYYVFKESRKISYEDYQWEYGFTRFCYRLKFLKENNIYFPEYSRYEDPPFLVKAMICAKEFYAINKVTYMYREQYKPLILTEERAVDMLCGMGDIIDMAQEYGLSKLIYFTLQRFTGFKYNYIKFLIDGNQNVEAAMLALQDRIDKTVKINELKADKQLCFPEELIGKKEFYQKLETLKNKIKEKISRHKKIAIYGQDWVAFGMYEYLKNIDENKEFSFFIWADKKDKEEVDGVPIYTILELEEERENVLMEVVVLDESYKLLIQTLKDLQFSNILSMSFEEYEWVMHPIV